MYLAPGGGEWGMITLLTFIRCMQMEDKYNEFSDLKIMQLIGSSLFSATTASSGPRLWPGPISAWPAMRGAAVAGTRNTHCGWLLHMLSILGANNAGRCCVVAQWPHIV